MTASSLRTAASAHEELAQAYGFFSVFVTVAVAEPPLLVTVTVNLICRPYGSPLVFALAWAALTVSAIVFGLVQRVDPPPPRLFEHFAGTSYCAFARTASLAPALAAVYARVQALPLHLTDLIVTVGRVEPPPPPARVVDPGMTAGVVPVRA